MLAQRSTIGSVGPGNVGIYHVGCGGARADPLGLPSAGIYQPVCVCMGMDMRMDMRIDTCIGVCVDVCMDMCVWTCA